MREAVITNLINNIIFCIWMYALVTNHRFRKVVTALVVVLLDCGVFLQFSIYFFDAKRKNSYITVFLLDIFKSVGLYIYDADTHC